MHLCNCKFDGLIFMVSLDFKTLWKMFTQKGGVCSLHNLFAFHFAVLL